MVSMSCQCLNNISPTLTICNCVLFLALHYQITMSGGVILEGGLLSTWHDSFLETRGSQTYASPLWFPGHILRYSFIIWLVSFASLYTQINIFLVCILVGCMLRQMTICVFSVISLYIWFEVLLQTGPSRLAYYDMIIFTSAC